MSIYIPAWYVGSVNHNPVLSAIGDQTASAGDTISIPLTATDEDATQTLTLSATGLPSGVTLTSTPLVTGYLVVCAVALVLTMLILARDRKGWRVLGWWLFIAPVIVAAIWSRI